MATCLCVAIHLYIYLAMRKLPSQCTLIQALIRRLRAALDTQWELWVTSTYEIRHWLPWILFVGYAGASEADQHWFIEKFDGLYARYGSQATWEFLGYLQGMAWEESFCAPCYQRLSAKLSFRAQTSVQNHFT
jgi:hypothetical protein